MTVGEKIRYYRVLKNLTQKELGELVLPHKKNSDARINQYERNLAAPKDEIRGKIADVLDVDIEALSDVETESDEDFMYVLFELEEKKDLQIYKDEEGRIHIVFAEPSNENRYKNEKLITYLSFWEMEFAKSKANKEEVQNYKHWKARFKTILSKYTEEKREEIEKHYETKKSEEKNHISYSIETSDFVTLLRLLSEAGFILSTKRITDDLYGAYGFVFMVEEVLNPPSETAEKLFAKFLLELDRFNEIAGDCDDAKCESIISLTNNNLEITYYIPVNGFDIAEQQIKKYLDFKNSGKTKFQEIENFENEFALDLKEHHNNIQDEIEREVAIKSQ